jgi:predicted metal-dependent hydrolase
MPAVRLLPDTNTLRRWVEDEGLTHQQIAERVFVETGNTVSRSTVSAALHRAGLTKPTSRYRDELPWTVAVQHITEYPARMLRLLGRQREGQPLSDTDQRRLANWLQKMEDEHAVVAYDPTSRYGFYYVEKDDTTDGLNGVPIRRQTVRVTE